MSEPNTALSKQLDYVFNDPSLLERALTHRSASKSHNERLEFLGDAVLGMVVAEILYEKFPKLPEGKLTRMRSNLVKGTTLATMAKELAIGPFIRLGPGELKSGGRRRESILADAMESIIGAVYLDGGFEEARKLIKGLFKQRLRTLDPNEVIKDNKTQLQEYLQAKQVALPEYVVEEITGKDHAQTFLVSCHINELKIKTIGSGRSRRIAEQEAAKLILEKLNND